MVGMGPLVTDKVGLVERKFGMMILGKYFGILTTLVHAKQKW